MKMYAMQRQSQHMARAVLSVMVHVSDEMHNILSVSEMGLLYMRARRPRSITLIAGACDKWKLCGALKAVFVESPNILFMLHHIQWLQGSINA